MLGNHSPKDNHNGKNDHRNDKQDGKGLFQARWSWTPILVLLALWFFMTIIMRSSDDPHVLNLSYTDFKQHVVQGNVESITVQGERIRGTFREPIRAPDGAGIEFAPNFSTTMPSFRDPDLMETLQQHNVTVHARPERTPWLGIMLLNFLPWLLLIGFFIYMGRRMQDRMGGAGGGIFNFAKSKAKRYERTDSNIRFSDVAGLTNAKRDLQEIIEYLKDPTRFQHLGGQLPKGVLLVGPPGTGKTLLARASAGEANVPFFSSSGSEFVEMFVGVGASRVRDMFENAKREAPAIIFIDEIDSIGRARGTGLGGGHDEREQTLNQILAEMDGFGSHESVVVMAATNRPDVLDPALIRPGRFDRQVMIDLPQRGARAEILRVHTRNVPLADDVDLERVAAQTIGFAGADLKNLVNEAALLAGRDHKDRVEAIDFDRARDKIILGSEREEPIMEDEKEIVAYHEGGHALVARLLPGTDPLRKVTIIPRGRALGMTEQMPEEERYNVSQRYLRDRLAVMLGGRVAEKLVFGDLTSGAGSDLKQATQLARRMVCQWGMSEKLGPVTFQQGEEHIFLGRELAEPKNFSEHTARLIDEEIQRIVREAERKAEEVLERNRSRLNTLAQALLERETLDAEEVDRLLDLDSLLEEADESMAAGVSD